MKKPSVDIIIPALNEERIIGQTVKECLKLSKYDVRVLVVVDGKTKDETATIARNAGAEVIQTKEKGGKGAVFRKAIPRLTGEYVIQIDADLQFKPAEIPKHIDALQYGADMTLGTRYQQGSMVEMYSVSFPKLFGSFLLSFITSLFASQKITDVMAGFKGFQKNSLQRIKPTTDHFGYEAELVLLAAKKNMRIQNIPITYTARAEGSSSVSSLKHGILVLITILRIGIR